MRTQEEQEAMECGMSSVCRCCPDSKVDHLEIVEALVLRLEARLESAERVVTAAMPVAMDAMEYHESKGWEQAGKRAMALDDALTAHSAAQKKGEKL